MFHSCRAHGSNAALFLNINKATMPKEEKKGPHTKGTGATMAGDPGELISLLIADREKAAQAIAEVTNEGPAHKQVFSALLLRRMYKLTKELEVATGSTFALQKGAAPHALRRSFRFWLP
jgi:hypothetical protein